MSQPAWLADIGLFQIPQRQHQAFCSYLEDTPLVSWCFSTPLVCTAGSFLTDVHAEHCLSRLAFWERTYHRQLCSPHGLLLFFPEGSSKLGYLSKPRRTVPDFYSRGCSSNSTPSPDITARSVSVFITALAKGCYPHTAAVHLFMFSWCSFLLTTGPSGYCSEGINSWLSSLYCKPCAWAEEIKLVVKSCIHVNH